MTSDERKKLLRAIDLLANDTGENDGWHMGMKLLHQLAGLDTSAFDIEAEPADLREIVSGGPSEFCVRADYENLETRAVAGVPDPPEALDKLCDMTARGLPPVSKSVFVSPFDELRRELHDGQKVLAPPGLNPDHLDIPEGSAFLPDDNGYNELFKTLTETYDPSDGDGTDDWPGTPGLDDEET